MAQIHAYCGDTADSIWCQIVKDVTEQGIHGQRSRLGETAELLHAHIALSDIRERWILSRTPALNPAFAIAEVFWILAGHNESPFINHWNPTLPRFAGGGAEYHGAYGYRLRRHYGFDQIQRAYEVLSANPDSRQCVLQIWDPNWDLPNKDGSPRSEDIPCNLTSVLKVRNGRLEWLQVLRSNDLYRGLPYNIVQFTTLQEILAGWLGLEPGDYHQVSDSAHIYLSDNFRVDPVGVVEKNKDNLSLPRAVSSEAIARCVFVLDALSKGAIDRQRIVAHLSALDLPPAFRNLLAIASADSARRRGWSDEMVLLEEQCSSPVLRLAWRRWKARNNGLRSVGDSL